MFYHGKKTDSMCYHGKKTVSMCYHEKKRDSMCCYGKKDRWHVLSWKNTFLVPLFYKIVRKFYVAHKSHRNYWLKDSQNRKLTKD